MTGIDNMEENVTKSDLEMGFSDQQLKQLYKVNSLVQQVVIALYGNSIQLNDVTQISEAICIRLTELGYKNIYYPTTIVRKEGLCRQNFWDKWWYVPKAEE